MFVVYRLQNRRLRFCLHPPQNHPFLTTRIGIIEDGLLRICQVKPDRLIVVVSLYRVVCYLSIAGAFKITNRPVLQVIITRNVKNLEDEADFLTINNKARWFSGIILA